MDEKLRQLQLKELEILDEFVRVCDKHKLRYYLVGGTLLGAVRHQGFIPWDDDIDVAMPRADYDALAQLWPAEADPKFFYQCPDTDPYYFLTYAKIRMNGTEVYEERFRNSKFHKGIFIDIFPLDYCPAPGAICHFLFNVLAVMNYRGQVDSGEAYEPYQELSGKIGYGVLRLFDRKRLIGVRRKLLRLSAKLSRQQYVASYAGAYGYHKEVYPAAWFRGSERRQFELKRFCVPASSINVLKQAYGDDFMEPAKKQANHISIYNCRGRIS